MTRRSHRPPLRQLIRNVVLLGVAMTLGMSLVILMPPRSPGGGADIAGLAGIATLLLAGMAVHLIRELYWRAAHEEELAAERQELEVEIARRRAAELAARTAQETLQDAVESISEAFMIFDANDRIVMFNDACKGLYAASSEAIRPGMSFLEMLRAGLAQGQYPEAIGREEGWLADRLRRHRELDGAVEQRLPDGRHLLITERRMRNGGVAGLRIDITRLKATEMQLRATMERLDSVQRIAGIGSAAHNLVTGQFEWSAGACAIFGIKLHLIEPTVEYFRRFVHPEDRAKVRAAAEQAAREGVPAPPMEYRIVRPDGAVRAVYRENAIERDAAGQAIRRIVTFKDITELKATETQLRETMEHLDRVTRVAGIGSTMEDRTTGRFTWSPGAAAIFGVDPTAAEPTPQFMRQFYHPDDRAKIVEAAEQSRVNGVPAPPLEYRIIRPDGVIRTVYRENAVERDGQGHTVRRIVTFKDITELKATETQLRETMDNLDRAQRLAHIGSYTRTLGGDAKWSAEMYRIFGVDPETFNPTRINVVRLVVPEDRARIIAAYREVGRGICPAPFEHKIRRPNGEIRLIQSNFELLRDRYGQVIGMGGTIWDITDMRRVEHQLREMMENLDRAQRLAHMGSYTRDIDGTGRWSAEVYRIFGVDPKSFEPELDAFVSMVVPEDRAKVMAAHRQMAEAKCPDPFEYRIRRPTGEVRYIHRITELIRDHAGRVSGTGGTLWDVTELRAAEERQKELERQLLHSQKLEALGRLAGGVAHDLNNTLVPILSLAKLALEDLPERDPLREDILTIVTASERARDLVKQILAFSRKQDIQKTEIDPTEVVRQALPMLRAMLPPNITFVERIRAVPRIFADPGQLQQVIVNLVTNAAQAIAAAQASITVELAVQKQARDARHRGSHVRLRVGDTGCGMEKAVLDRIFEPFFTTKPVGEGTGLGLSVVHGIVTGHGGTIDVSSKLRKGTVFTVLLPIPERAVAPLGVAA
jgi:PAS domain S-box-containing protein